MSGARASAPLLARNAALNFATEIGLSVVLIAAIPLVLRALGTTAFGLLLLAWTAVNYIAVFDFGVSRAATKYIAEDLARHDLKAGTLAARTSASLNLLIGSVVGGLVIIVAPLVLPLLRVPPELRGQAHALFLLVGASVPIVFLQSLGRAVLVAFQRFDWNASLRLVVQSVQWILIVVAARRGLSLAAIFAVTIAARAASVIIYAILIRTVLPDFLKPGSLQLAPIIRLMRFGGWITVAQSAASILIYLDRALIAGLLSLASVSIYAIPYEMVMRLRILPASVVATLFPAISERTASSGIDGVNRLYAGSARFLVLLLLPFTSFICVFAPDILTAWMGPDFALRSVAVTRLITIAALLTGLAYLPFAAMQAMNRPDLPAKINLLQIPVFVVSCLVLIPRLGLVGAGWALILRFLVDITLLYGTAHRLLGCSLRLVWERGLSKILLSIIALDALLVAVRLIPLRPLVHLGSGLVVGLIYAISAWLLILQKSERPMIMHAIRPLSSMRAS